MNVLSRCLATVTVGLLAGCASGPSYQEVAQNIPALEPDVGRIYLYRVTAMGFAVQPAVRVDGEPVGKAVPRGFFYVDRPAGSYEISARTEAERDLTVMLDAGEEKYVRLEMKMGVMAGHVKPVLVDPAVGREEMQKTSYVGE